jgi:RimJ/RimL family protein N-acetyltransferase
LDKEKVIGFNLISFGEVYIPLLKLRRALKDDEAWSEQIYIHKDFRRMHLASDLRYCVFEELKKRKIKTLYGSAWVSNEASLNLARKLGFANLMDIHFTRYLIFKTWKYIKLNVLSHLDGQSFYQ